MLRFATLTVLLLVACAAFGQEPTPGKYRLELLSMIRSDSTRGANDIQASILVTPLVDEDWPPVLSMRIGFKINEADSISYIDIQNHAPQKVRLTVYDRSVAEKNAKLYAHIRSKLDLVKDDDLMILWFECRDLHKEAIQRIEISYGLWEKNDLQQRVEERFSMEFTE